MPIALALSSIFGLDVPGYAMPEKSPFISIITTLTPFCESCSENNCMDFVLPVPVAPAMSPCRFIVLSGAFIWQLGMGFPSNIAVPNTMVTPLKV